mmetsp:Transcript_80461/g.93894  ORF Transcript_80461/g.93894 Transcript_80461/m.93894 type:complete len:88 (+) Transcript_80461:31-294(+)
MSITHTEYIKETKTVDKGIDNTNETTCWEHRKEIEEGEGEGMAVIDHPPKYELPKDLLKAEIAIEEAEKSVKTAAEKLKHKADFNWE